jgi:hypothetical protein
MISFPASSETKKSKGGKQMTLFSKKKQKEDKKQAKAEEKQTEAKPSKPK